MEAINYVLYLCLCGWGCMSNTIHRGAKDFSFSAVLNSNMEAAKKEYYIWVYWNCCPMNRDVTVRIVLYTSFSFQSICTEFVFVE